MGINLNQVGSALGPCACQMVTSWGKTEQNKTPLLSKHTCSCNMSQFSMVLRLYFSSLKCNERVQNKLMKIMKSKIIFVPYLLSCR